MSIASLPRAPNVLLVDLDSTVRVTLASVCRDLNVARVFQATSIGLGEQWLKTGSPKGLVLSMSEEAAALALLTKLRAGDFPCGPDIAVVVMAHACTPDLAKRLKQFGVRRLLLQPFKLRDVIETLEQLWPEGGSEAAKPANPVKAAEPAGVAQVAEPVDSVEGAEAVEPIETVESH
jgi:DNA-binding NtrC family response regulator